MKRILSLVAMLAAIGAVPAAATTYGHINWAWTAPASSPVAVASYNLYITTTACSSSFSTSGQTAVNAAPITATTYQTSYTANQTGCAYVTAVSAMGVEGTPSAGFPINTSAPSAPTGLVGTPGP